MFNKTPTGITVDFKDTIQGAWYIPYLATAKNLGIVSGYPDGTFKPNQTVNKVEAMKIILKTSGSQLPASPIVKPFNDTPLDSWYLPYAEFFKTNSLDTGNTEGNLQPDKPMTRAEIAEYLYGFSKM